MLGSRGGCHRRRVRHGWGTLLEALKWRTADFRYIVPFLIQIGMFAIAADLPSAGPEPKGTTVRCCSPETR